MKLKIILLMLAMSGFEIDIREVLCISLAKPSVLTMFILPIRVSFLLFQLCRVCSKLCIFSSKLSLSERWGLYEKCTPRACTES